MVGVIILGGVIDSCYHGELIGILINFGNKQFDLYKGDKFTQILFIPVLTSPLMEVKHLSSTT